MDHRIDVRKGWDPSFGRRDVAGDWRRTECGKFFCRDIRTRQGMYLMSAPHEFANDGGADRAGSAENEDTHDFRSVI
jgi:hypothetical protein